MKITERSADLVGFGEGAAGGQAGGQHDAFGPLLGFLCGWMMFTVITGGSIATLGAAFPIYLGAFVPLTPVTTLSDFTAWFVHTFRITSETTFSSMIWPSTTESAGRAS